MEKIDIKLLERISKEDLEKYFNGKLVITEAEWKAYKELKSKGLRV